MSFELGKYALPILLAYGVSFLLLALLIGYFLWQRAQSKMELEEAKGLQDA